MTDFLSQSWIDAADAAVSAAGLQAPDQLVIQQLVRLPDDSVVAYYVALDSSGGEVSAGVHAAPTVTYEMSHDVAAGIASGTVDPYAEFMAGRLELSGDSAALVAHHDLVEALQKAIAAA